MNFAYQEMFRMTGEIRQPRLEDPDIVCRLPTFRAAMRYAVNHSGLLQEEVADALGIDPGGFSKMLREPRHDGARQRVFPPEKIDDLCRVTGSYAPIQ